jgi:hypothetical protein
MPLKTAAMNCWRGLAPAANNAREAVRTAAKDSTPAPPTKRSHQVMSKTEFHNALRILHSIDLHELQTVGLWLNPDNIASWVKFQDNPYLFFIRADDETSDKIWQVVVARNRKA